MYTTFNTITGYTEENTSVRAMRIRLIVLESIAGIPGFVAASRRHWRSMFRLGPDHGWIATQLEEAENERMHLVVCLEMFKASLFMRTLVVVGQTIMTPFFLFTHIIKPGAMHRFAAYLEETGRLLVLIVSFLKDGGVHVGGHRCCSACKSYSGAIAQVERPGTPLHTGWAHLEAPDVAKAYWKLPKDAKWVEAMKCMVRMALSSTLV
jgi:ubiquinol oxidase